MKSYYIHKDEIYLAIIEGDSISIRTGFANEGIAESLENEGYEQNSAYVRTAGAMRSLLAFDNSMRAMSYEEYIQSINSETHIANMKIGQMKEDFTKNKIIVCSGEFEDVKEKQQKVQSDMFDRDNTMELYSPETGVLVYRSSDKIQPAVELAAKVSPVITSAKLLDDINDGIAKVKSGEVAKSSPDVDFDR